MAARDNIVAEILVTGSILNVIEPTPYRDLPTRRDRVAIKYCPDSNHGDLLNSAQNRMLVCVVFVHESLLEAPNAERQTRIVPCEGCLVVSPRNKVRSLPGIYASKLRNAHSLGRTSERELRRIFRKHFSASIRYTASTEHAGGISKSFKSSAKFRKSFLRFVASIGKVQEPLESPSDDPPGPGLRLLLIAMTTGEVLLNHSWDDKVTTLVVKQCILDDAMNWLSTLGGAYSALGDQDVLFADRAGSTSLEQLRIAMHMASPPLVIRCKLFFSISLMQRNEFKMAKKIIRTQYELAKSLPVEDKVLMNMCHGIWNKLRFLWQRSKVNHSTTCLLPEIASSSDDRIIQYDKLE